MAGIAETRSDKSYTERYAEWLALLGASESGAPAYPNKIIEGPWTEQVLKDMSRCLTAWVPATSAATTPEAERDALHRVLSALLDRHRDLHYFQGLHDIAGVLVLTLGERRAWVLLDALCDSWLRPWFDPGNGPVTAALEAAFSVVWEEDRDVGTRLKAARVSPLFALAWVITWFAHANDDIAVAQKIFAMMLESHPLAFVYFAAALTLRNREFLLAAEDEKVMKFFMGWPLASLPTTEQRLAEVDSIADIARELFERRSPRSLYNLAPSLESLFPTPPPRSNTPIEGQRTTAVFPSVPEEEEEEEEREEEAETEHEAAKTEATPQWQRTRYIIAGVAIAVIVGYAVARSCK
eukprot:m51a1_g1228 hypothetical protein (352) ;mRNA; f:518093-519302